MELWPERRRKRRQPGSGSTGWGPWADEPAPGDDADVRRTAAERAGGHVLIVANRTAATPTLLYEVERRARERSCRFTLLIPNVTDRSMADWTLDSARELLERVARRPVAGLVGGEDPFESIQQAVREHDFDEILISTLPQRMSKWLRQDLPRRVERLGVPVTVVTPVKQRLRDYQGPLSPGDRALAASLGRARRAIRTAPRAATPQTGDASGVTGWSRKAAGPRSVRRPTSQTQRSISAGSR